MSKYMQNSTKATNFAVKDSYKEYDFLRGEGPSSAQHFYDPLEKKAFRPGWQSKKHVGPEQERQIKKQEAERLEQAQVKASIRREHVQQRKLTNAYNPITGQEYNSATKSWEPSSNPWSHHRPCVKPQPAIAQRTASSEQGAGSQTLSPPQAHDRMAALSKVTQMRRQRIASEGLPPSGRKEPTMKEILQWS